MSIDGSSEIMSSAVRAALGLNAGQSCVTIYGEANAVGGGAANVPLWVPLVAWDLPAAPVGIEYASTSANDTATAGTGARRVVVEGVGPGFGAQSETVVMNGVTPVASALTWMAINSMTVQDNATTGFGSGKTNSGDITAKVTGAGALHGFIEAAHSLSIMGRYTVPAGFTLVLNNFFVTGNKSGSPTLSFKTNRHLISPSGLFLSGVQVPMQNGLMMQLSLPASAVVIPEKFTMIFRLESVSASGLDISAGTTGFLIRNY